MKDYKSCYDCKHYKGLYTLEEMWVEDVEMGLCKKKNRVVGDRYYCIHHTNNEEEV